MRVGKLRDDLEHQGYQAGSVFGEQLRECLDTWRHPTRVRF